MKTIIRKAGNSQGTISPKQLLAQIGLEDEAVVTIENGAPVLPPAHQSPRRLSERQPGHRQ